MSKFIMMVGLPASSKSTIAQQISIKENAIIHASDSLRKELFGNEDANDKNDELFKELHSRIKADLRAGKNVTYDATNINYKRRKAFLEELKKIDCEKICCLVATPYEKCLEQNKLRERKVPEYIIKKMYLNFYIPQDYEGWDKIVIIYNTDESSYLDNSSLFQDLNIINQDNPNHSLTIGQHCMMCSANLYKTQDYNLVAAGLYHDIGKKFTKQFKNSKGEDTEIAHYYQHHNISAYIALFYLMNNPYVDLLQVIKLIQWHMQPFFMKEQKTIDKFIRMVGQEFYDKLMILHEADKKAK